MKKLLFAIIALLTIFSILTSFALPIISAEHDCSHEDCAVCTLISAAKNLVCLLYAVLIARAALSDSIVRLLGARIFADLSVYSPVGMKVKLSD